MAGYLYGRKDALNQQAKATMYARQAKALEIRRTLQTAYYTIWFYQGKKQLWQQLDSLYSTFLKPQCCGKTGESAGLDSIAAKARSAEIKVQLRMLEKDIAVQQTIMSGILNTDSSFLPKSDHLKGSGL